MAAEQGKEEKVKDRTELEHVGQDREVRAKARRSFWRGDLAKPHSNRIE